MSLHQSVKLMNFVPPKRSTLVLDSANFYQTLEQPGCARTPAGTVLSSFIEKLSDKKNFDRIQHLLEERIKASAINFPCGNFDENSSFSLMREVIPIMEVELLNMPAAFVDDEQQFCVKSFSTNADIAVVAAGFSSNVHHFSVKSFSTNADIAVNVAGVSRDTLEYPGAATKGVVADNDSTAIDLECGSPQHSPSAVASLLNFDRLSLFARLVARSECVRPS